jgi:putative methionine-R-sulfoxide reductase with GAF domain
MMELLKDRHKVSLIMATLFILGIIVSMYTIYSLPHDLMLAQGYQALFVDVYVILAVTFLLGGVTIWYALQDKNEVIVFRDRQLEAKSTETENTDSALSTISLESVRASLKQSKNEKEFLQSGLHAICKQLDAGQGAIYRTTGVEGTRKLELRAGYALNTGESTVLSYEFGEGLVGQSAAGVKTIYVDDVPDGYIKILSGLGSASPRHLLIVPMKKDEKVIGVMEIASFTPVSEDQRKFVEESAHLVVESLSEN